MLGALTCLLLLWLLGEAAVASLRLPVPGSVVGMVLLFSVLALRGGVPEPLRVTGNALLHCLMLLLVPATVGLITHVERIGTDWPAILASVVGGAAVTIVVTALTLHLLTREGKTP